VKITGRTARGQDEIALVRGCAERDSQNRRGSLSLTLCFLYQVCINGTFTMIHSFRFRACENEDARESQLSCALRIARESFGMET
jgi:hypothetical protein